MRPQFSWSQPLLSFALTPADLHIWQMPLEQPEARVAQYRTLLSADEQARADRFHFDRDRRRYTVARGELRSILGRYLDVPPARLTFDYGPHGKPRLLLTTDQIPLQFNVAHSHELALCAIARSREVGIDVEYTQRRVLDMDQLAARFFSANENATYRAIPAPERRAAFFRCWTRKEAFIKAIGEGLSYPLDRFDVNLDEPAAIRSIDGLPGAAAAWLLFHLEPAADYVGAVAVSCA